MTEFEVKTNINLLIRDLKNGRLEPEDIIVDGKECQTVEEAITTLKKAQSQGLTSI